MKVKVLIPTALRHFAENQDSLGLEGRNIGEILQQLTTQFPNLKRHLFTEEGKLRNFVNVYVNDEDIRHLQQDATTVSEGDVITIVPAIAGGSGATSSPLPHPLSSEDRDTCAGNGELSHEEILRYSRHLIMPEVAMDGQKKMKKARVLLIGVGGLGSPLGLYLSAAGVGQIGLVDFDVVEHSNLQRQIIHSSSDIGRLKLDSARDKILSINPHVQVTTYETALTSENALEICSRYDIVIDGTDNFATRYLVNDACVLLGKPNIYGSIFRFEGQASVFDSRRGPCYRCLYPAPPPPGLVPSCAEGGVLGILPGIIGLIQATEAVKLILGKGESLIGRLLLFDALAMKFRELKLRKNPACPICGDHPVIHELIDYREFCGLGQVEREILPSEWQITPGELKIRMDQQDDLTIVDVREPHEAQICRLPNSRLIPLHELSNRVHELDRDSELVIHCRSGVRSREAVKFLHEIGFPKAKNLEGGILAWSNQVDPTVPKY